MKSAIRLLADLAPDFVLAPERHVAETGEGVRLGDLVEERREPIDPSDTPDAVILDTSHARDGLLDIAGALRDVPGGKSLKKRARAGDLVVSRLRPYLRQVAFVHPDALRGAGARPIALSTEFYVLSPRSDASLAFLVPFLLSDAAQAHLAAAQEGGHHPRVPRSTLLAMRVPESLVANRTESSRAITRALGAYYRSLTSLRSLW